MLRKYDLKEASWYLENPVKKTIWTSIVKKTVYSYYAVNSGTNVVVLLLCFSGTYYTGANYSLDKVHQFRIVNR